MRQVALEHGINAGPPVVMVLTGQSASEMEPWRYGSKIWTMVMTIVQNTDCNKLNWSNFIQVNLALCHSVRNELREYLHLVCFAYIFVNTGNYCSNRVFKSDRSWPVIWPVFGILTGLGNLTGQVDYGGPVMKVSVDFESDSWAALGGCPTSISAYPTPTHEKIAACSYYTVSISPLQFMHIFQLINGWTNHYDILRGENIDP